MTRHSPFNLVDRLTPLIRRLTGAHTTHTGDGLTGMERRRRAEAEHRHAMMQCVMDDNLDGIAVVNRDGIIETVNRAAEKMLGWQAEGVIGTPIHARIPWTAEIEDLYGRCENLNGVPAMRRISRPSVFTPSRDDGIELLVEFQVRSSKLPVSAEAANIMGGGPDAGFVHIYTFRDITERQRIEDAREKAMTEAADASHAKSDFLANMSHELRTPLNAVIGFSEVLKAEPYGALGAPQYIEYVEDIFQSGQHLLSVINEILDMSKIEAGEMELTEATVDIQSVAKACLRLVSERALKGNVAVSLEPVDTLPWLYADERMVKQMLLNLLTNAVKFTPPKGSVTLGAEIDPAGCLVLSVTDTGVGIKAEDMEKVLRPFGQAGSTLQREFEGTGLGLPLVKAMAELHGAVLVIDSNLDAGTRAAIRFPIARVVARAESADNQAA